MLFVMIYLHYVTSPDLAFDPRVIVGWIFASLLVATTYIDLDHYIIPDEISLGGMVAGLVSAVFVPSMVEGETWLQGLGLSALGAAVGVASLYSIVRLGKLAFGRKKLEFDEPLEWKMFQVSEEEEPTFSIGGEDYVWSDLFFRPSDRLLVTCTDLDLDGRSYGQCLLTVSEDAVWVQEGDGEPSTFSLEDLKGLEGTATGVVIPREAMGLGDVKFVGMVGAFLGWKSVIFTVFGASAVGAVVGIVLAVLGKREMAAKVPFGPYLAVAAFVWMLWGAKIVLWYQERIGIVG